MKNIFSANTICDQRDKGNCEHFEMQNVVPSLGARPGSANDIGFEAMTASTQPKTVVRELFPEVWLFNDYTLK